MPELGQFVGEDSRKPIQRLRRYQLWRIADKEGLRYPPGASKEVMIKLFEANNIDVTQSPEIQWFAVDGRDSQGNPRKEFYPDKPIHSSARNGVDANSVLNDRLSRQAEEEQKRFEDARLKALEKENAELRQKNEQLTEVFAKRLEALEGKTDKPAGKESTQSKYWATYRKARDMGFKNLRGKKLHELEAMIAKSDG